MHVNFEIQKVFTLLTKIRLLLLLLLRDWWFAKGGTYTAHGVKECGVAPLVLNIGTRWKQAPGRFTPGRVPW
jgi:hypothetical protein